MARAGGHIKIGAQGGIKLQPVFVVALDPIHFAVAPGKISHAPQHLIVILQAVHPVILGERLFQLRGKAVIRGIAEAQHIHAVFFEMHAKPAKAFGEVGRNKYKIHGSLHPFLYTSSKEGQGAAQTGRANQGKKALQQKGIPAWVDYWGYDVSHDWPWWKKQLVYFLPYVLNDIV